MSVILLVFTLRYFLPKRSENVIRKTKLLQFQDFFDRVAVKEILLFYTRFQKNPNLCDDASNLRSKVYCLRNVDKLLSHRYLFCFRSGAEFAFLCQFN